MKYFIPVATTLLFCFTSCKKEVTGNINAAPAAESASVANLTLLLQPGANDGNDLWTKNWINHPSFADTCDSKVALIKGLAASLKGSTVYTRSIIKFDGLSNLPNGAKIIAATLYLYGPNQTSKDVKQHLPTGNSSYPGSGKGDNTCLLQRITGSWNEQSVSWNNPPATTTENQVVLKASNKKWEYDVALDVTEMTKAMTVNPAANNGFLLKLQTEQKPSFMGFLSSNSPETARRPKLLITYTL